MPHDKPDISGAIYQAGLLTQEFAILHPEQIIIEDIAMALGIIIIEGELYGAEARLLRKNRQGIIRLKSGHKEAGRKRFTIAHELGHWVLHSTKALWLCSAEDIYGPSKGGQEAEANAFAGAFLMPTRLISPVCWNSTPDLGIICDLAKRFQTSITATAIRFVEECRQACVVVFSENHKVKWWRANQVVQIWIEPGQDIDSQSNAWDSPTRSAMEQVDHRLWFPNKPRTWPYTLFEQSMVLGTSGITITLLYLSDTLG